MSQVTLDGQARMDRTEGEVLKVISDDPVLLDLQEREGGKEQQVLQDSPEHKYKVNLYLDHQDQAALMEAQEPLGLQVQEEREAKGEIKEWLVLPESLEVFTHFLQDTYIYGNIL